MITTITTSKLTKKDTNELTNKISPDKSVKTNKEKEDNENKAKKEEKELAEKLEQDKQYFFAKLNNVNSFFSIVDMLKNIISSFKKINPAIDTAYNIIVCIPNFFTHMFNACYTSVISKKSKAKRILSVFTTISTLGLEVASCVAMSLSVPILPIVLKVGSVCLDLFNNSCQLGMAIKKRYFDSPRPKKEQHDHDGQSPSNDQAKHNDPSLSNHQAQSNNKVQNDDQSPGNNKAQSNNQSLSNNKTQSNDHAQRNKKLNGKIIQHAKSLLMSVGVAISVGLSVTAGAPVGLAVLSGTIAIGMVSKLRSPITSISNKMGRVFGSIKHFCSSKLHGESASTKSASMKEAAQLTNNQTGSIYPVSTINHRSINSRSVNNQTSAIKGNAIKDNTIKDNAIKDKNGSSIKSSTGWCMGQLQSTMHHPRSTQTQGKSPDFHCENRFRTKKPAANRGILREVLNIDKMNVAHAATHLPTDAGLSSSRRRGSCTK